MQELFIKKAVIHPQNPAIFFQNKKTNKTHFKFPSKNKYNEKRTLLSEIPELPLLENLTRKFLGEREITEMQNTAMIGVQHILPTTGSLFKAFLSAGFQPENMFFQGKFYSTVPYVENYIRNELGVRLMNNTPPRKPSLYQEHMGQNIENMWKSFCLHLKKNQNIDKIIILDEGGHCLEKIPKFLSYEYKVAAIEQTRFGFYNNHSHNLLFPVIDVARSAAKKNLESPLIAESIIDRLDEIIQLLNLDTNKIFGVIGNGAVGSAVLKHLLSKGYKVLIYDKNDHAFTGIYNRHCYRVDSIKNVISGVDIVLSCTGKDITKENNVLEFVKNSTIFASCTSQNIEFLSLIQQITQDSFLSSAIEKNLSQLSYICENGAKISILENGFPINFDRTNKSDPVEKMTLTRGLLFSAVIQAALIAKRPIDDGYTINRGDIQILDPYLQKFVAQKWIENLPDSSYTQVEIDCFDDIDWIKYNSTGKYEENKHILNCISSSIPILKK